jgi:hypothetical protein
MANFKLKKGADEFQLDTAGSVSKAGAKFGTWTTTKDNKILIRGGDGSQTPVDAAWKFNAKNQLCLVSNAAPATEIFNFHTADGLRPFFSTDKAVLQVFPDEENDFNFLLRGEWDLDDNHDLNITINGLKSVIDGFVDDPKSRFIYHFFDEDKNDFNIMFTGTWAQDAKDPLKLNFTYTREDDTVDVFSLPGAMTIDRGINQFVYDYDKDGKKRRIQLIGLLNVSKSLVITYSLDRQDSEEGGVAVASTEFRVGAVLTNSKFQGDVEFLVKKTDGTTSSTTIGIRGKFTAQVAGAELQVAFLFVQNRNGDQRKTSFGFSGQLKLKDNGTVQWEFASKDNVKQLTITITDVKLGPVTADSKFVLQSENGQTKKVQFLLGVSF